MSDTPTTPGSESRALHSALSGPVFSTKNSGSAMHAATRHVERWAPEAGANQVRSLRTLGFVDRLAAPWLEVAQRSASMRLFQQYRSEGLAERPASHTSWLFPRPWYQDELDWMTASREAAAQAVVARREGGAEANLFTTRGTYVAPAQRQQVALPAALYEHVAPSLSIAPPIRGDAQTTIAPTMATRVFDAYSPLVPFAAVNAAQLMQRAVAPLIGTRETSASTMSAGLRSVLSTMLERSVAAGSGDATRSAANAPELVTPPAPRADQGDAAQQQQLAEAQQSANPVVQDVAAQRVQIAELQRATRIVVERQIAERTRIQDVQRAQHDAAVQTATQDRARVAEAASTQATTAERSRVEDRIAQRMAERAAAQTQHEAAVATHQQRVVREQRLHESAREAAARDAQVSPTTSQSPSEQPVAPAARVVPQEITAALAKLSPQLAGVVASNLAASPERSVQVINELGEALRNAELIARSAASGGSFAETRGPRLVMPAGLGGLVATVDQNVQQSERRAQGLPFAQVEQRSQLPMAQTMSAQTMPMIAPRAQAFAREAQSSQASAVSAMRMPAIAWLAAPNSPAAMQSFSTPHAAAATSALGATEGASPAAIQHVAWADRWLARFSGANTASLDLLSAASASPSTRLALLAEAAPGTVFVAPQADHSVDDSPAAIARREAEAPQYTPPVRRYDDNEATPDDVLAAISRQAARTRAPAPANVPELVTADRPSLADAVAHTVPVAPAAGFAAQLASSPFAPAFRHVFPVAQAPAFDVRALFGESLSAAYLAGMLAPTAHEVTAGAAIGQLPGFETFAQTQPFAPISREAVETVSARFADDFAPTYVAPIAPTESADAADGMSSTEAVIAQQQAAAAQQAYQAQQQIYQQQIEPLTTMRSALLSWNVESIVTPQASAPAMTQSPQGGISYSVDAPTVTQLGSQTLSAFSPATFGGATLIGQSMLDAMTMPMIGDASVTPTGTIASADGEQRVPTFAAPGMIADRAQAWSVAQERSSADLSFDFVTPELVLAARVYGLGPAEAAQAMRLAIAGPGQLATMASTVNRTFVQAMAIEAERQHAGSSEGATSWSAMASQTPITAYPAIPSSSSPAALAASFGMSMGALGGSQANASAFSSSAQAGAAQAAAAQAAALQGGRRSVGRGRGNLRRRGAARRAVHSCGRRRRSRRLAFRRLRRMASRACPSRRSSCSQRKVSPRSVRTPRSGLSRRWPRWPSWPMQTVKTRLLRRRRVVRRPHRRCRSWHPRPRKRSRRLRRRLHRMRSSKRRTLRRQRRPRRCRRRPSRKPRSSAPRPRWSRRRGARSSRRCTSRSVNRRKHARGRRQLAPHVRSHSPVAATNRSRRSSAHRSRGRCCHSSLRRRSARRSAVTTSRAWSSRPVSARSATCCAAGSSNRRSASQRMRRPSRYATESRPGLSSLSSRAGEALGSYVAPEATPAIPSDYVSSLSSSGSSSGSGSSGSSHTSSSYAAPQRETLAMRAPTAQPDYVQTGSQNSTGGVRSTGRFGGGEVEIPTWFEAAARKMFDERNTSMGGDISLSELTLVSAAPSTHIAASERSVQSAAPANANPGSQAAQQSSNQQIDIEKVANEVYKHILVLMDGARARNGEPYL